jgi:hypothetical protein
LARAKNHVAILFVNDVLQLEHATHEHQWTSLTGLSKHEMYLYSVFTTRAKGAYVMHVPVCLLNNKLVYSVIYIYTCICIHTDSNFDMFTHWIPGNFHQSSCLYSSLVLPQHARHCREHSGCKKCGMLPGSSYGPVQWPCRCWLSHPSTNKIHASIHSQKSQQMSNFTNYSRRFDTHAHTRARTNTHTH